MICVPRAVLSMVLAGAVCAPATAQTTSRCIALPLPALRGAEGGPNELSTGVRDLVSGFLKGPSLRPDPPGVVTRASTVDATLHTGKDRIKASSDGEDLVTPLVERMAGAVAGAVPR